MNQYLKETPMLNFSNPNIQKLIKMKHWKEQNKFKNRGKGFGGQRQADIGKR